MKKSVPRISKLEYSLETAKRCCSKGFIEVEKRKIDGETYEVPKDIYEVIFEYRKEEEDLRRSLTRRYVSPEEEKERTRGKYLFGISLELVNTLHRWGLLYQMGNAYQCSEEFMQMGKGSEEKAKTILLKRVLQHEQLFSRFLLTLRDSSIHDNENSYGQTYCEKDFMERIGTNRVSLDVICSWGYFFGLTYDYKTEKDKTVKRKLILTCFIAEIGEILEFLTHAPSIFGPESVLETMKWPCGKMESVLHFLTKLGVVEETDRKYKLTSRFHKTEELISLAKNAEILLLDSGEKSIVAVKNIVNEQDFKEAVLGSYKKILARLDVYAPISVPIEELRAETCENLRISGESFDSLLIKLHEKYKEYVWLTGASQAMRQLAAKEKHVISGKPLKYNDQYFSFVTLVWERIK